MAISSDTGRVAGRFLRRPKGRVAVAGPSAPLGPTVALTVTLAVACFVLVMAPVELLVQPEPLPPPLDLGQKQNVETALYIAAFGLMLPAALLVVPRLADAIAARASEGALSGLAAVLTGTLAASIMVARALPDAGVAEAGAAVAIWSLAAVAALARATRSPPWPPLSVAARRAGPAWAVAGLFVLGSLLAFTSVRSISPLALATGLAVLLGAPAAFARRAGAGLPRLPRRWGVGIDIGVVVLVLLAVPDLVIFSLPGGEGGFLAAIETSVIQFHHNFVLGPANVVLNGGAVLVDTASQYGVGSIYFLAAWFQLAPIGYGTLGFLDGALFALFFAGGYCVLRLAHTPRPLAAAGIGIAVIVLIYNLPYSVGSLPAQHGPIRFGLPMLVILAATLGARFARGSRAAGGAQLAVVGVASVWALEAFVYTGVTFAAIACFRAWTRPVPRCLAWLAWQATMALAACLGAHLALTAATFAFTGRLPDYGQYLAFLQSFAVGQVGNITYDFSRWSPALVVGVAYAASAAAFVLVLRRRPGIVEREQAAFIALCGVTAYGIVLYSYFVDRSADHILPYVCLPALLAGGLWLGLLMRGALGGSSLGRLGGLAFALAASALMVAVAWSSIGDRLSRSALGHVAPGGPSAGAALHDLWNLRPLDPRAPRGEELLARFVPGQPDVLTLTAPDLELEILLRSGRTNELPLSYPTEDSFAGAQYLPALGRFVADLRPGHRVLTDVDGLRVFEALRAEPSRDPLTRPASGSSLAPLQQWVLQRIGRRFGLQVIHRDEEGLVVAELTAR